jgi:zinc D-Ala-D-Ala carboxypeptidase
LRNIGFVRGWVGCIAGFLALTSAGAAGTGAHVLASSGPSVVVTTGPDPDAIPREALPGPSTSTSFPPTTASTEEEEDKDDAEDDADEADSEQDPENDVAELLSCTGDPVLSDDDPLEDWPTIVLDQVRGIASDFEPPDLVEFEGLPDTSGTVWIGDIVVDDLTTLLGDADDAGAPLTLVSGYRTYEYQETLYNERIEEDAHAGETTAHPGHSEHQLGTTIDVLTPGMASLSADFGETPAGEWLQANAADYGFVVSYPADSQDTTCYDYEPWHIRYVGEETATEIDESGLTPREWMLLESPGDEE